MNQSLVSSIKLPDDKILEDGNGIYRQRAKDLVTGVADKAEVEFVIENLGEAISAARDDFCCDFGVNLYIDLGNDICEIVFDLSVLPHLFGIFANRWKQTQLYNELRTNHPEINYHNLNWLDEIGKAINPKFKSEIIDNECSERNMLIEKLNWQKMMIKIFSFINLGELDNSQREDNTFLYKEVRNKYSDPRKGYLLVRSLRNAELENIQNKNCQYYDKQIFIKLVEEEHNGQKSLIPVSIYIVKKPLDKDGRRNKTNGRIFLEDYGIRNNNIEYKFFRMAHIDKFRGGKYGQK